MLFDFFRDRKRRKLIERPLPDAWRALIDERLVYARRFDEEARGRFLTHLKLFAWEKNFEGVRIEFTDEMRIIISGAAARLSMNVTYDVYNHLDTIIVYPDAYVARDARRGPSEHVVDERPSSRLGQASDRGIVVLSWDAVRHGLAHPRDGHDVALHEFAHVIDFEDGTADGAPFLDTHEDRHAWAKAFSRHFELLQNRPRDHVVDAYGATDPAEFFACATEVFFERPRLVKRRAPDLYAALASFYQADPADRR